MNYLVEKEFPLGFRLTNYSHQIQLETKEVMVFDHNFEGVPCMAITIESDDLGFEEAFIPVEAIRAWLELYDRIYSK